MKKSEIEKRVTQREDVYLFTSRENKYYLASLLSDSGYVVVCDQQTYVLVDGRYYTDMLDRNKDDVILLIDEHTSFTDHMSHIMKEQQASTIGIENTMDLSTFQKLKETLSFTLTICDFSFLRMKKKSYEQNCMRKACAIVDETYIHMLSFIKLGMSEKEVANELVYKMKTLGADTEAFDTIVLFGKRGALPHGKPSHHKLTDGDFVTMDFGAIYQNYCSDITRSFQVGEKRNHTLEHIYDVVLEANEAAISSIHPGMRCQEIDKVARDVIIKHGYGEFFTHNLGHSIGIKCHEDPRFAPASQTILEAGMTLTVEPGIYLPGIGGIRIEDDILVMEDGCEVLTQAPKERMRIKG